MPHAVVLSHRSIAHELGHLEPWFDRHGFTVTRAYRERPAELPSADLLVVMGSPGSVADGFCTPPDAIEIGRIRDWVIQDRPYLGICYGAQALASATGASVRRMDRAFTGYAELDLAPHSPAGLAGPWLTWHEDGLTASTDAEVLGRLDHADLAFRTRRAWGLQPHIEVTPDIAERMLIGLGIAVEEYAPVLDAMRADESGAARRAAALLDAFLDEVA